MINWRALVEQQLSVSINYETKIRLRKVLTHHPKHFDVTVTVKYDDGYDPPDWDGEGERQLEPTLDIVVTAVSDLYAGAPIEEFSPAQVPVLAEALEAANGFGSARKAYEDSIGRELIALAGQMAKLRNRRDKMLPLFDRLCCIVSDRVTGDVVAIGRAWNLNLFADAAEKAGFSMQRYCVNDIARDQYEAYSRSEGVKVI